MFVRLSPGNKIFFYIGPTNYDFPTLTEVMFEVK